MKSPKAIAASSETEPRQLADLAKSSDPAVRRAVARNPRTPAQALEKLSHDADKVTRQAVAGNPNASADVLMRLGAQFPTQLLENPALDALVLENPSLFSEVPEETLTAIAKRETCSHQMLGHLARAGHGKGLLMSLVQNGRTPADAIRYILETSAPLLAERYVIPEDNIPRVKGLAAHHVSVRGEVESIEARETFWRAVSERLRVAEAGHIGVLIQRSALPQRYRDDVAAWTLLLRGVAIACRTLQLPASMLEAIACRSGKRDLKLVQACANCPEWLLRVGSDQEARQAIEANRDASEVLWREATASKSDALMLTLAGHPLADGRLDPQRILEALAIAKASLDWRLLDGELDLQALEFLSMNPHTSGETLRSLYENALAIRALPGLAERFYSRYLDRILFPMGANPNTPSDILRALAERGSCAVAMNPAADGALLWSIYGMDGDCPTELAANPATPPDLLIRLAQSDPSRTIKLAVAGNPSSPEEALWLVVSSGEVRFYGGLEKKVIKHPNVSGRILDALIARLGMNDLEIYGARLARDPRLCEASFERLEQWASTISPRSAAIRRDATRKQLASNPSVSMELLQRLASDKDEVVKRAAARSLKQRTKEPFQ